MTDGQKAKLAVIGVGVMGSSHVTDFPMLQNAGLAKNSRFQKVVREQTEETDLNKSFSGLVK